MPGRCREGIQILHQRSVGGETNFRTIAVSDAVDGIQITVLADCLNQLHNGFLAFAENRRIQLRKIC